MPRRLQPLHTGWRSDKPLPTVPASPTLTNPDMVLPDGMPNVPSPPRWVRRPPSPSYLRDVNSESPEPRSSQDGPGHKMMLLRNRSPNMAAGVHRGSPMQAHVDQDGFIASSPILRDTANSTPEPSLHLQPPRGIEGSQSGSSSSEAEGLANFLAKYEQLGNGATSDEDGHDTDAYEKRPQTSYELKSDVDAQRRKQQQEEQNSAILSQRAEQILANAKKRLNVMEGNLRGARDLLPLTAANLKRATSLGSNHHYTASYSRDQFIQSGYGYDHASGSGQRTLRGKASSPTMGHEFVNHARGFSVNELPDRPHTSFDNPPDVMAQNIQRVSKTPEPTSSALRSSKSYEALGGFGYAPHSGGHRERSLRTPDSGYLEPLHEDEELRRAARTTRVATSQSSRYDSISRPSSRASSIREQLTSLKGRIESMKERAREDNLRRQSMQDLRNTPFNNATTAAPEFYYNAPAAGESPVDAPAQVGGSWFAETDEVETPATSSLLASPWENGPVVPGSRNAFAEQMAAENLRNHTHPGIDRTATRTPNSLHQPRSHTNLSSSSNERIRDHTIAEPKVLRSFLQDEDVLNQPFPPLPSVPAHDAAQHSSSESSGDVDSDNYAPSVSETSFYEEATNETPAEPSPTAIVAHEDRADAFDYENFFLQSAMARYTPGPGPERPGSDAGSDASASSTETARGPSAAHEVDEEAFEPDSELFPPATPETPERLRQIEYNLHQRTRSTETVQTFATAYEGNGSPIAYGAHQTYLGGAMDDDDDLRRPTPSPQPPQPRQPAGSRPSTAVQQRPPVRRSSSSDRADSGVGLNQRSASSLDAKRPRAATVTRAASTPRYAGSSAVTTPPRSPRFATAEPPPQQHGQPHAQHPPPPLQPLQDPAIMAVNALLDPNGKQLGLRSKAVLFSVVESLRKVALRLQEEDEAQYESRVLRRRLDDAKNALDGVL